MVRAAEMMKMTYHLWNITPRQNAVCRDREEHTVQAERGG